MSKQWVKDWYGSDLRRRRPHPRRGPASAATPPSTATRTWQGRSDILPASSFTPVLTPPFLRNMASHDVTSSIWLTVARGA